MTALALIVLSAFAADIAELRTCAEPPRPRDIKWAIARTVRIERPDGSGTGVVTSADGFILTAAHVVKGKGDIQVVFHDGTASKGTVVRSSVKSDLALVHVERTELPCMPIRTEKAEVGSDVFVIGSPGGKALSESVSKGIVSGYRENDGKTLVQTDASINGGNSGGPLVGETGEVIGIVSFKLVGSGVEGLGFAIAATDVAKELSVTLGIRTDPRLLVADDSIAALTLASAGPRIDLAKGVVIDEKSRYKIGYKPQSGWLTLGLMAVAGGGIMMAATNEKYGSTPVMDPDEWTGLKTMNTVGWAIAGSGVVMVGLGFAPARSGKVVVVTPETP